MKVNKIKYKMSDSQAFKICPKHIYAHQKQI